MLNSMRNGMNSWITRIFLFTLFGFALLGLVMTDVNGFFRSGVSKGAVVKIDGQEMSVVEFDRYYKSALENAQSPEMLNIPQYREMIANDVLRRQIRARVSSFAALDSGLIISDRIAAQQLRKFLKPITDNGMFEETALQAVLQQRRMSEDMLVATLKDDLAVEIMMTAFTAPIGAPKQMLDDIMALENEERSAHYITLETDDFKIEDPDEATLKTFYEEQDGLWMTDEYRGFSAIVLTPELILEKSDDIEMITDEGVKELYDARIADFSEPDIRTIAQAVFQDEETAQKVQTWLAKNSGKSLDAALKSLSVDGQVDAAEDTMRSEIFPEELAGPVFDFAKEKGVVGPVKSPLGYHVVDVQKTVRGKVQKFSDVKEQLAQEWILQNSADPLFEMVSEIEDILSGGSTVEEAASFLSLEVHTVDNISRAGIDKNSSKVKEFPYMGDILKKVFQMDPTEDMRTDLIELDNGVFIAVGLGQVIPPEKKPFDIVKRVVKQNWLSAQRYESIRARSTDIITAIRAQGSTLEEQAKKYGYDLKYIPAKKRKTRLVSHDNDGYPNAAAQAMFDIEKVGDVAVAQVPKGTAIVALEKIKLGQVEALDEETDPSITGGFSQALLKRGLRDDIINQFLTAKGNEYKIKVNRHSFDKLYGAQAQAEQMQY